ncbi:hypothetical protein D9611_004463 [Ephemerocybe angulata]|uniref:FAS1 domain-containing protein n=1 Tax=Ephemerocybe angulata TaxID=980116 RepID=A0A8H5F600_9AGAR|nr:hypothetical protein D9611_004463 [Tulosesus angulatus]
MLPALLLQLFIGGVSAAALTLQIQNPFDSIFGNQPWKHYPKPHPNPEKTIYETIVSDGRFTALTKAINFVGDDIIEVLNDASHSITFFAVPDTALHHGRDDSEGEIHPTYREDYGRLFDVALADSSYERRDLVSAFGDPTPDFASIISAIDSVSDYSVADDGDGDHDGDDDERKRRRKVIKYIVNAVLQYHVLPFEAKADGLLENNTYPTHLKVPHAMGGHHQRVRVSHKYKKHKVKTFLNHHSKIVVPDVQASNGYIHVINHPIIPPGPVFQELFLFQNYFSIFTSALQRTGLTNDLDLRYKWDDDSDEGHFEGSPAVTVFAVPNKAFAKLPKRLQWYLFSPFGTNTLRKLLEYHIVPGIVAHTDHIYNRTAEDKPEVVKRCTCPACAENALKKKHPHREPISAVQVTLDTRFTNHTLDWLVERNKLTFPGHGKHRRPDEYETNVYVNYHKIKMVDIVGLNGVIHVVDQILCPWHHDGDDDHHHHHGDRDDDGWEGWESWLPQLAAGPSS